MFRIVTVLCLIMLGVLMAPGPEGRAEPLKALGQPLPPFITFDQEDKASGFSVDLFNRISALLPTEHPAVTYYPVTFARLYHDLQLEERRVGLAVGRNPERENMFKWVGPYMTIDIGVIGKKSKDLTIKTALDLKNYTIATVKDTAPEQALLEQGLSLDHLTRFIHTKQILSMLDHDRVDLAAMPLQVLSNMMSRSGYQPSEYEDVFHLKKVGLYFAFSKDVDDREINAFQETLDEFMETEAYRQLFVDHEMSHILPRSQAVQ